MAIYHRTQRLQIYGDKPEVTQLFGGRYRMEVRCVAAKDTEAWYNANKDQIFASFGTLYSAEMSIDGIGPRVGEAYANMVLISNKAGYTPTGEYVISFVYETLIDSWVKEKEDIVSSTENGLRTLTRTEVATIDTEGEYDEDGVGVAFISSGGKTLYLAGFENQTKADDEVQIGRFITRWAEAGVISRTEDFVGSQDSLVIEAIGPDPETPSGFSLAKKQESNYEGFRTKRFTFLKNNVVLSVTEDKVGSRNAVVNEVFNPTSEAISGIDTDGTALTEYSEASRTESDYEGIKTIRVQFLKHSILSVQQEFDNGRSRISVQAFNLDEGQVDSELSSVISGHQLISTNESDYEGIITTTFQYEIEDFEVISKTENGLKLITQTELKGTNFTERTIGTERTENSNIYLAGEEIDNGNSIKKRVSRWAQAGVLDISKEFRDGLLYVTFNSQGTKFTPTCLNSPTYTLTDDPLLAFQGGTDAVVLFDRQRNVNGFRIYTVTSVMKKDGGTLGTSSVINQRITWENYEYPGYVDTSFTSGIVPVPGGNIPVRVTVTETLTTSNTVGTSDIPFAIKQGCYVNVNFIPTKTGLAQSVNKTFGTNYLAGSIGLSGSNTTFLGMPVSSIAGGGSSNPTYANFLIESNPILAREIKEDFITDAGVQWYRIVQVQLVGTFGDYD